VSSTRDVFEIHRAAFRVFREEALADAEPVDAGNVWELEERLVLAEVDAAALALAAVGPPPWDPGSPRFVQQSGTTCMSTSLANALISLGEPCLLEATEARAHALADDIVANTSALGKPGDYRSVDDLFKYLESGRLPTLLLEGGRFAHDYRVRLTASLLDVVEALWTGKGRLVMQKRAHARLAFALEIRGEAAPLVRVRDPLSSRAGHELVSLELLRREFLWSPLKKIPRLMGPDAFESLEASELMGHLTRYDEMDNLGVECPSALVYRVEDAPPRLGVKPEEGA
jgi:hypothetical protein